MSKATVTRIFLGSVIAVIAGALLALATVWIAYANGAFVMNGPDVVGIRSTPAAWAIFGFGFAAMLAMMAGFVGGMVSWIGALLNTSELEDKTWFVLLLVLGVLSVGLVAMIAYVIAGPDGTRRSAGGASQAPA